MLNVLYMEFRRLFKQKSFYVVSFVLLAINFLILYTVNLGVGFMPREVDIASIVKELFGDGPYLAIMCIVIICFIATEYNKGFIKNYIGQIASRAYTTVSHIIVSAFFLLYAFALIIFGDALMGKIMYGSRAVISFDSDFWKYMALTWYFYFAMCCLIVLITNLLRSIAMPIAFSFLVTNGFIFLICSLFSMLIYRFTEKEVNLSKYFLSTYLDKVEPLLSDSHAFSEMMEIYGLNGAMIIAAIYIILGTVLSSIYINKKDIV